MRKIDTVLVTVLILFSSCSIEETHYPLKFSYPSEIGYEWVYRQQNITYVESIIGDTILSDGREVKILQTVHPDYTDLNFLYVSEDTIILYESLGSNTNLSGYVYPMTEGDEWYDFNGGIGIDSTHVIKEMEIEVFKDQYYIGYEMRIKSGNYYFDYDYTFWFVPNIGIIKTLEGSPFTSRPNKTIELIEINFTPEQ